MSSTNFTYDHHVTLQRVLFKERINLLEVLFSCVDFNVSRVNLTLLYTIEDKHYFFRSNAKLQQRIKASIRDIFKTTRLPNGELENTYHLYQSVVGPFLEELSPVLKGITDVTKEPTYTDLFCWSIMIGNQRFMLEFWKRTSNPVWNALLGSYIARKMASVIEFGKADVEATSRTLEEWAIAIMEEIPSQEPAYRILSQQLKSWGPHTLLDMAMLLEMKARLAYYAQYS